MGLLQLSLATIIDDPFDDAQGMQVLRDHRETLISVLETFVHDPLVEWTQGHRSGDEIDNPHAKDALATIEGLPLTK